MGETQRFLDEETGKRLSRRALSRLRAKRRDERLATAVVAHEPPYDSMAVAEAYKRRVLSGKPEPRPADPERENIRKRKAAREKDSTYIYVSPGSYSSRNSPNHL